MKIAFKGFRGFGQQSDFFDLRSLTVLTGKNGSGKSTLLKLLELISINVRNLKSFENLFDLEFDIGNDLYGGKNNILHDLTEAPQMIFETRFEFYTDIYEIHVKFEVEDYILKIKSIDIIDKNLNLKICTYGKEFVRTNCKYLFEKYKIKAYEHNLIEEYIFCHDSLYSNEEYTPIYYISEDQNEYIESLMKNHISRKDESYIGKKTKNEEYSHHFKEIKYFGQFDYSILEIPKGTWKLSKNQIKRIIENSENSILAEEFKNDIRSEHNPDFDLYEFVFNLYNNEIENFLLGIPGKKLDNMGLFFERILHEPYIAIFEKHGINDPLKRIISFYDEDGFLIDVMASKFSLISNLAKDSTGIFEKTVLEFFQGLNYLFKQSSVVNIASRSYNIYENNSFSNFLKVYITCFQEVKELILDYLRINIKNLEIADDIELFHEGNTGFIYLIKGTKKFSLIDEGSGINNLLSILLFLSIKLDFTPQDTYKFEEKKKKIIILEEPESNLHPCLQSKVADILSDYISKTEDILIVETHSEYLIRKLQYLVAKKKLQPDNVIIYYFNLLLSDENLKIESYSINIDQNGILDKEFGTGFFDEADNIAIDLFTLKKSQQN